MQLKSEVLGMFEMVLRKWVRVPSREAVVPLLSQRHLGRHEPDQRRFILLSDGRDRTPRPRWVIQAKKKLILWPLTPSRGSACSTWARGSARASKGLAGRTRLWAAGR